MGTAKKTAKRHPREGRVEALFLFDPFPEINAPFFFSRKQSSSSITSVVTSACFFKSVSLADRFYRTLKGFGSDCHLSGRGLASRPSPALFAPCTESKTEERRVYLFISRESCMRSFLVSLPVPAWMYRVQGGPGLFCIPGTNRIAMYCFFFYFHSGLWTVSTSLLTAKCPLSSLVSYCSAAAK